LSYRGSGPAHISGDPVLLAQAIGNLIDNALKYTPEGGAIAVAVQPHGEGLIDIDVTDNGPGISDEEKPKVSDRFYRGDASRGTPGVGLGLTLVASVAKVHGGALELTDNHPGLKARMVLKAEREAHRLVTHPAVDPHDRSDSGERRDERAEEVHRSARQSPQSAALLQKRHDFG